MPRSLIQFSKRITFLGRRHDVSHNVVPDAGHDVGHDAGHDVGQGAGQDVGHVVGEDVGRGICYALGHDVGHDVGYATFLLRRRQFIKCLHYVHSTLEVFFRKNGKDSTVRLVCLFVQSVLS